MEKDNVSVNAKCIFGILCLSAATGDAITIKADGPDENSAIEGIQKLFDEGL